MILLGVMVMLMNGSRMGVDLQPMVLSYNRRPVFPSYFDNPNRLFKPILSRSPEVLTDLVKSGDHVYYQQRDEEGNAIGGWDLAPIVVESHKLIFFTIPKVGCTVWKQLFRRMNGANDWLSQDEEKQLPHNPSTNGLKYLYHYSLQEASKMMTSSEWTRAIMVRDPKERFLSSFLDKAVSNNHQHIINRCCPDDQSCVSAADTLEGFLELCGRCDDEHWRPQHDRMESKYWPYVDEVCHVETAAEDARRLLERIGAWEEYGASGWGEDGQRSMFESKGAAGAGEHATWAQWQVWKWYTPDTEARVEGFYQGDYENPLFNFTRGNCVTCAV